MLDTRGTIENNQSSDCPGVHTLVGINKQIRNNLLIRAEK